MRVTKDEKGRILEIYTLENGSVLTATVLGDGKGRAYYLYQLDGLEIDKNTFDTLLSKTRVGE